MLGIYYAVHTAILKQVDSSLRVAGGSDALHKSNPPAMTPPDTQSQLLGPFQDPGNPLQSSTFTLQEIAMLKQIGIGHLVRLVVAMRFTKASGRVKVVRCRVSGVECRV